ncbi:unnamed protein product [Arabidopsis arenosa]|uniref:Uncharacterized protein n=1 Tax=Arabidopsis arenosa TaxID=38785 RepID=A0A8S2AAD7_ARAAE|nr:unnamed protein product [Arabidopsis arenosa]
MARSLSGDTEVQTSRDSSSNRGGWRTFPFMIATLLGLSIASFGWVMNLVVFLIDVFNIKSIAATQISNIVNGCVSMLPVVAAILADSFFGNIPVISVSAFISLLGILLLTLITSLDYLRPPPCQTGSSLCQPPSQLQLGILYAALALVIIGSAGTRFTLASAGANQYEKPKEQGSFFNWYFLTLYSGAITGATAIVYTQENASWELGFGLCAIANLISFIVFVSGKRFYKHDKPMGSPFTNLIRVVVAATAKRKAVISSREENYHHGLGRESKTSVAMPSQSFSFFNRAALKTEDYSVNNMWRLCSVQEVEDFKAVFRVLPLLLAIIFVSTPMLFSAMADSNSGDTEAHRSSDPSGKRGGWITLPFMLVTLFGMSVTYFGWVMNLIVFLMEEFNIKSIAAVQISNIVNGLVNMLPVVAAIIADSYFGNIPVISASAFISLTGISLLTLITSLDYLRPRPCETGSVLCQSPSTLHLGILYAALALVITGTAGTRFILAAAGANQYKKPKEQGTFFNWYFFAFYGGAITGTTAIVYAQDNASWKLGFGLCVAANLISFIVFVAGKRLYNYDKPLGSPYTSLIRVLVAATVKRKAVISSKHEDYHQRGLGNEAKTSSEIPSKSFR